MEDNLTMTEQTIEQIDGLEQLPDEPDIWYDRFRQYALLGPGRSIAQVYRMDTDVAKRSLSEQPNGSWYDALAKWRWKERAANYDLGQREVQVRELAQRREEFGQKAFRLGYSLIDKAEKLVHKADAMLEFPLARRRVGEDGSTIIEPSRWTFRDTAAFLKTAAELAKIGQELVNPYGVGSSDGSSRNVNILQIFGQGSFGPEQLHECATGLAAFFGSKRFAENAGFMQGALPDAGGERRMADAVARIRGIAGNPSA